MRRVVAGRPRTGGPDRPGEQRADPRRAVATAPSTRSSRRRPTAASSSCAAPPTETAWSAPQVLATGGDARRPARGRRRPTVAASPSGRRAAATTRRSRSPASAPPARPVSSASAARRRQRPDRRRRRLDVVHDRPHGRHRCAVGGRAASCATPQHPASGAAVTDGELRLNGLQIVPDAGVQVVIDPHARTIDTTGARVRDPARHAASATSRCGTASCTSSSAATPTGQTLFDFDTQPVRGCAQGLPDRRQDRRRPRA